MDSQGTAFINLHFPVDAYRPSVSGTTAPLQLSKRKEISGVVSNGLS